MLQRRQKSFMNSIYIASINWNLVYICDTRHSFTLSRSLSTSNIHICSWCLLSLVINKFHLKSSILILLTILPLVSHHLLSWSVLHSQPDTKSTLLADVLFPPLIHSYLFTQTVVKYSYRSANKTSL